jgi:hypothetical protein
MRPHIFLTVLCEPERHGWINPILFQYVCHWLKDSRFVLDVDISGYGYRSAQEARNTATKTFLASDAEYLIMIDNDTIPKSCLPEMALDGKSIVSARVPVYGGGWNVYHLEGLKFDPINSVLDTRSVDAVGAAAICIRRDVIEGLLRDNPSLPIWMQKNSVEGRMLLGEDILFSCRAKDLGFDLEVAVGHDCGHLRTVDLKGE